MANISRILKFLTRLAFDEFGWNDPISCKSTILADVDNTPKKLMTEQTHGRSLKKFTAFIIKQNVVGSFWLFHSFSITVSCLDKFYF